MLRKKSEQLLLHQLTQANMQRIDKVKIYGQKLGKETQEIQQTWLYAYLVQQE